MIDLGRYFILILKNKSKFYYRIENNEGLQEEFRDERSMMEYQISKQGDEGNGHDDHHAKTKSESDYDEQVINNCSSEPY